LLLAALKDDWPTTEYDWRVNARMSRSKLSVE